MGGEELRGRLNDVGWEGKVADLKRRKGRGSIGLQMRKLLLE